MSPVTASPEARTLTLRFDDTPVGEMVVVVAIPATREPLPLLIAMHGLGESLKGPTAGAKGWLEDYHLDDAIARLAAPPITSRDYQGLGDGRRRAELNASLEKTPYRGLVIAMPYTPNILLPDRSLDGAEALGRFLVETLLPRLRAETPVIPRAEATGIDGVSLGGRAALLVGLAHPESFGAIGTLQAAIDPPEVTPLVGRIAEARTKNPELRLRLLTSSGDFYRGTLAALSRALKDQPHELRIVEGPHDYIFNRGPGAYEMLLFHDRVLRGEPAP
ncbi:MAG: alpha/beta hydrolase-fold protein [Polyangiaceae bacterium]